MRKIKGYEVTKDGGIPEIAREVGDVRYPTFYIGIEHLPEAKDWKMGATYDVTLRLKQTGLNIRKNEGKNTDIGSAEFEILGIEPHGEVKGKTKRYGGDE